ncbi:hypothetical protein [Posidoniimonas polymericola]|uniref:hypothetical protein n=1 Tax=Posidoniimonas polymericola TaxID=2528002 RepID=UPI0011B61E32|nr:hypothetical protein [Posidoniimonas polymericola]
MAASVSIAALCLAVLAPSAMAGPIVPPPVEPVAAPTGFWANASWACRRVKLRCQTSAAGKFLTNAIRPVSKLTGGLIPVPNDNHFAGAIELHATKPAGMAPGATPKPPPPPPPGVAAAAAIKAEQSQAKLRREAVAYLAGLDCRYYPEAEAALIASLRADRDECVRLEAARALLSGCCCTPATTKALFISASGTDDDGNPCERSTRVRRTALAAWQKCQSCVTSAPTTPPEAPIGALPTDGELLPASYEDGATEAAHAPVEDAEPASGGGLLEIWRAAGR